MYQYDDMQRVISNYGPYELFVTLTFRVPIGDDEGWRLIRVIMTRLHRTMLGCRWQSQPRIEGIVALERTSFRRGLKVRKSCHFHILIKDHVRFAERKDLVGKQVTKALNKIVRSLRADGGPLAFRARDGVDVRVVVDEGVCGYIVKESRAPDWVLEERVRTIASCVK